MTCLLCIIGLAFVLSGLWWIIRVWKPWDDPPKGGTPTPDAGTKGDFRNPPKTMGRGGQ